MINDRRLRLFIIARIVVTLLFLVSVIVLKFHDYEAIDNVALRGIVSLMAFSFVFSAISLIAIRFKSSHLFLTYIQILWDLLFVTLLVLFTDGIDSPYSFLYLLAIMNAGMLLSRREAIYTAALCGILYGAIVDLQYFGMLNGIGLSPLSAIQHGEVKLLYNIFLHLLGYMLTALVAGYLTERARRSEDALRKTEINYDELKRLHSTVVNHLEYGLITVTTEGRIRVFNPYAERLASITQEEAYDKLFSSIFPDLYSDSGDLTSFQRGEFSYFSTAEGKLVIGCSIVPFPDSAEKEMGAIVTLRNLTDIRQMELALKRSDRLAALGELSARMAHEIRNPLAAISGSVQLLADHGSLRENESRLLAIVIRESERLNNLISEFLAYARPTAPRRQNIELAPLLDDLLMLLSADEHFSGITISKEIDMDIPLKADQAQFQQVLLNLLQNAAESMPGGGEINISATAEKGCDDFGKTFAIASIRIEDRGCGIDEETSKHLFEPFWTTKPSGTGLGLATVYRIVEGHGGTIQADARDGGGTKFTILLPIVEDIG